jgi:hypothetical protein
MIENELVSTMVANGKKPRGYMDRITFLRAYRPARWNPDYKLQINVDVSSVKGIIDSNNAVIDAVIVEKADNKDAI